MQLQQEKGNKQHILAEDSFGNEIIPSLCHLIIAGYSDCFVLGVFSSLEKKLLAYKVTNAVDNLEEVEQWLKENFNKKISITFTGQFEITPDLFSSNSFNGQDIVHDILISYACEKPEESIHYLTSLINFNLLKKLSNQLYLFNHENYYTILLMNKEVCLLANSYRCENENEVLYFLLNALQISDLLQSETTLNIDYSLTSNQALIEFLSPHFAHTEILAYSTVGLNEGIPQLPEKLFACFATSLCA